MQKSTVRCAVTEDRERNHDDAFFSSSDVDIRRKNGERLEEDTVLNNKIRYGLILGIVILLYYKREQIKEMLRMIKKNKN